jgi:hypothetical protein
VHGRDIAAISEEKNGIRKAEVLRFALEFLPKGSISGKQKLNLRHGCSDSRRDSQKS